MGDLRSKLEKEFNKKYGDALDPTTITKGIQTGWVAFDYFAPIKYGTSILIDGDSQSGKSLLMMMLGASVQKDGGLFICFNTEAANRDSSHLSKVVPDLKYDEIMFKQPDYIEYTVECIHSIIENTKKDGEPVFIAIDSISSCATKSELEAKEFKSKDMSGAEIAAIWSKALRQVSNRLSKKPIILCMVSQLRVSGIGGYVTKDTSTGGKAPFFYASTGIRTRGKQFLYRNTDGELKNSPENPLQGKSAQVCSMYLNKSRYNSGGSTLVYLVDFEYGISKLEAIVDLLIFKNILNKSGSWYSYKNNNLGQGKLATTEVIKQDKALQEELIKELGL